MPFYSKKDFAKTCGMPTKKLAVYIGRGQVLMSGEVIDDALDVNKLFLAKWAGRDQPAVIPEVKPGSGPIIQAPENNGKVPKIANPKNSGELYELTIEQKQLDIDLTKENITKGRLQNQKLQGDNIPTDLVKGVLNRHNKSLLANFKVGIDNLIIEIEKVAALTREQVASLRGDMIGILNTSMDNAINESKGEIHNIVKEVSIKRRRGEHD